MNSLWFKSLFRNGAFTKGAFQYFLGLLISLWLLHGLTFSLFFLLPRPEFGIAGWAGIDPEILEATRQRLGLAESPIRQYLDHLARLIHGDFGRTLSGFPVTTTLIARLQASTPQWAIGLGLLVLVPVPLGMLYCRKTVSAFQRFLFRLSHLGFLPPFLAAVACQAFYTLLVVPLAPEFAVQPLRSVLAAFSGALWPCATLFAATASTATEVIQKPFILTYESIGMPQVRIQRCLFSNVIAALRPLVWRLVMATVTGTIFSELIFGIPGVGHLFVDAIRQQDFALMQAYLFIAGGLALTIDFLERMA